MKLKILKGDVKKWEKSQKVKQRQEHTDLDVELQHLVFLYPLKFLLRMEAHKLVSIKNRKEKILANEVLSWRLKIQAIWIDQGDANTKIFHNFASARRNVNSIWELLDGDGNSVSELE